MSVPLIATFRKLRPRAPLQALMQEQIDKLEKLAPSLLGARVLVERRDLHHRSGTPIHVRVTLAVRGAEIVVEHSASTGKAVRALGPDKVTKQNELDRQHRHAEVAIRAAFAAARRRLQDHLRRERAALLAQAG